MQKLLYRLGVTVLIAFLAIQVFRPSRENPAASSEQAIGWHVAWQPGVASIFERACRDCHSNETEWPWYSNIAPASWLVAEHVNHARSHMNVSKWSTYDSLEQAAFLGKMCDYVRMGTMPLPSYTWIHREANLSDQQADVFCRWTKEAVEKISVNRRPALTPAAAAVEESEGR